MTQPGTITFAQDTITANPILSPFGTPSAWDMITIRGQTWGAPSNSGSYVPIATVNPLGIQAPSLDAGKALRVKVGQTIAGLDGIVTQAAPGSPPTPNGYVVIEGAERRYSWDPKHGKAQEGWNPTYQGTKGKQFKIKFRMWTDAQFQYWLQYRKMFDYLLLKLNAGATVVGVTGGTASAIATGTQVNALKVRHPKLSMLGISAIYCENVGELKPVGDKGEWEVQVDVWEFRPPPPRNTVGTPTGTGPSSGQVKGFQFYRTLTQVQIAIQTLIAEQHAFLDSQAASAGEP
jgi:hypothetical protein